MGPGVWEILKESIKEELVNEIKEYRSDIELKQAVLNTYSYKLLSKIQMCNHILLHLLCQIGILTFKSDYNINLACFLIDSIILSFQTQ